MPFFNVSYTYRTATQSCSLIEKSNAEVELAIISRPEMTYLQFLPAAGDCYHCCLSLMAWKHISKSFLLSTFFPSVVVTSLLPVLCAVSVENKTVAADFPRCVILGLRIQFCQGQRKNMTAVTFHPIFLSSGKP